MKILFAILLVVHALIHLTGTAKAYGWAAAARLTQPVSRPLGLLWLLAAVLLLAAAVSLFAWPRWWWAVGAAGVVVSQVVIITSWSDAKFGTAANAIALAGIVIGFAARGPMSLRAEYERNVARGLARAAPQPLLADADLAPLPPAVQRYVRLSGAVGRPRVTNVRAWMHGRIRSGPGARWMPFTVEQVNFYDEVSRFFLMDATTAGVPVAVLHQFIGPSATMRARAAYLLPVVDGRGPEADEAETVTLFNDMCVLAPATLVDPRIRWGEHDAHTVHATFSNAGHTVSAVLTFDDRGELTDFVSDDRLRASSDGRTFTRTRWSTPLGEYRAFGAHTLAGRGEGRWHGADGDYAYIELRMDRVEYNVAAPGRTASPPRP
jgi:hypothetical protein